MTSLTIDPNEKVESLQTQFNHLFPYLKIECFATPHKRSEGSSRNNMFARETRLGNCMKEEKYGVICIYPSMPVLLLEKKISKQNLD